MPTYTTKFHLRDDVWFIGSDGSHHHEEIRQVIIGIGDGIRYSFFEWYDTVGEDLCFRTKNELDKYILSQKKHAPRSLLSTQIPHSAPRRSY